ncbi:MAG TPA: protein kinase [Vicinamibacterales bacterium]|nr:protein kinase [Vicinamibacterales bacterium]
MAMLPGTRLGAYEVTARIGVGGMGEVYQATDTRLKRQVAIKVLPEAFAADPDRVARFHREADAVAALNHPGIAAIYDLAEAGGTTFLVLEFVEGETLADRLARGPLAVDEAVGIARQILEALEAAHEKGICHRDLKPANVSVTRGGVVKVLDFGLAKVLQRSKDGDVIDPSTTFGGTSAGVILGTAGYMSPEQAKGLEADQRSDIFSFGCILYELLSGRRAFEGDTASEQLASVLKSDVDLSRVPPALHPRLFEMLRRCLEKNPRQRWHAAADVRLQLDAMGASLADARAPTTAARPLWQQVAVVAGVLTVAALAAGFAAWTLKPDPSGAVTRFTLPLPEGQQFSHAGRQVVALSRDGTKLVYVANRRLYLRHMSDVESRVIAGSELPDGVQSPVFSPDGQWVAFRSVGDATLKRLPVTGGAPVTICKNETPFGLNWSEHGLLFGEYGKGILRVSPDGGTPEVIVAIAADEVADAPQMLPGGKAVLFSIKKGNDDWDKGRIVVQSLADGTRTTVIDGAAAAQYVPTGHLVYAVSAVLFAVRFDADSLRTRGRTVSIVEGVDRGGPPTGVKPGSRAATAQYAFSSTGSLVFVPGARSAAADGRFDLALFDRKQLPQPLGLPPARYAAARVSPDGKWAAFEREEAGGTDVYLFELAGTSAIRRLTFGGKSRAPVWSADSQWIAFQSDRDGDAAIFWQRADGSGTADRLTTAEPGAIHIPQAASPDGAHMLFTMLKDRQYSLWDLTLKDLRASPFANVQSPLLVEAAFSPDGRWVVYTAGVDRDGTRPEIMISCVEPFPRTGAKYQVPAQVGGGHPVWSATGDAILINRGMSSDAAISVMTTPRFVFGRLDVIAHGSRLSAHPAFTRRNWDVTADGRILGVTPAALPTLGAPGAPQIAVVLNWFDELKRLVPSN